MIDVLLNVGILKIHCCLLLIKRLACVLRLNFFLLWISEDAVSFATEVRHISLIQNVCKRPSMSLLKINLIDVSFVWLSYTVRSLKTPRICKLKR